MNTFNFFLSALCLASAATAAATDATKVAIKDNTNHVLKLGTCEKEAIIEVKIESEGVDLPFLFPKFDKDDKTKATAGILTNGSNAGKVEGFPGHFKIAEGKYKYIKLEGTKKTDYEVYVIPPTAAPTGDAKNEAKTFHVKVDFKCDNAVNEKAPKEYEFTVTNDARVVSLVSSVAVIAATFFLIL